MLEGIILAGGTGSRLYPETKVLNKHLLPLYDKPMIFYSLSLLMELDIKKINIVCNAEDIENYKKVLKNGERFGIRITYVIQEKSKGLIDAVYKCKDYIEGDRIVLLLGDNFFYGLGFSGIIRTAIKENIGATMIGIPRNHSHIITTIEFEDFGYDALLERNFAPKNKIISPGIFVYNNDVFSIIDNVVNRNLQAEWIEINEEYKQRHKLFIRILDKGLIWYDVGMCDSRLKAEVFISQLQEEGTYIGYIEAVAYKNKWISRENLLEQIDIMPECNYKKVLREIVQIK